MKKIYLYIKESPEGLKYLGKTVRNPYKYLGSGTRWRSHLKSHNFTAEDLKTQILFETTDKKELREKGLYYSKLYDVVNSKEWANLIEEKGEGGDRSGQTNTPEHNRKISQAMKGDKNPAKRPEVREKNRLAHIGKVQSEESNRKRSETLKGRKRPKEVVEKIKKGLTGRTLSEEHREALRGPRKSYGKQVIIKCKFCGKEGGQSAINRWHNDNCKHKEST